MNTEPLPATGLHTASLRRRVTVLVLAVLAGVLVTLLVLVNVLFGVVSNRDASTLLNERAVLAQELARQNVSVTTLLSRVDSGGGIRTRLVLADGSSFGSLPRKTTLTSADKSKQVTLGGSGVLDRARLTLVVDNSVLTGPQSRLRRLLLLAGVGALVVTAGLLVVIVRVGLRPLDTMTSLARSIASGGRGRRLWPTRKDTELGRAAAAFDDMLDALEGAETQARTAARQARTAEAAARSAEIAARESAERTKRFVADAAHELRTPIAGVAAVAEAVLQQGPDADPDERERLHLLLIRESRRAGQLVDDLLDLARIDAGVELDIAPVRLRPLMDSQAERIRLLAPQLTVSVEGEEVTAAADGARVTQILANLLDNARQATPADGRIRLRLGISGTAARIQVTDTGHGVPEADRERIFDRLVRLDQARDRRSGGSGLGLAIARGFARAHGGELRCDPPADGASGAVFTLLLPLAGRPDEPATEPFVIPPSL